MIVRRWSLVLGLAVVGCVFPAVSEAGINPCSDSDVEATCHIKTTPIHEGSRGFELTLFIGQEIVYGYGGVYKASSWAGDLSRREDQAAENDEYTFRGWRGHPLQISWGGKSTTPLTFAKIKGTFANGRGSIDLTFHPTGRARHVSVPGGCRGHGGQRRRGTLSGSYTLRADRLGTITQRSFEATISTADYTCGVRRHEYGVETNASHQLPMLEASKPTPSGPVSETIDVFRYDKDGSFDHSYTVSGLPSSDFQFDPSTLNAGEVTGAGAISGTATYSSTYSSSRLTTGRMRGNLAVTFASIGRASPFPRGRAAEEWSPDANR